MSETREQVVAISRKLTSIVGEMFTIFEEIHEMLQNWSAGYHLPFIEKVLRLQDLERELYALDYDEMFVQTVKQAVYRSVFSECAV